MKAVQKLNNDIDDVLQLLESELKSLFRPRIAEDRANASDTALEQQLSIEVMKIQKIRN